MWLIFFLPVVVASGILCPEGKHKCPDASTCCQLPDLTYGCCPMQSAVCCDDHIHCCPQGTKCDAGLCLYVKSNVSSAAIKNVRNVCPGGQVSCPDGSTCCTNQQGEVFGCCLLPDAICCTDGQHCCPKGSTCDDTRQTCHSPGFEQMMYDTRKNSVAVFPVADTEKIETVSNFISPKADIICPGSHFHCSAGETCCQIGAGAWGCCPFPKATCCSDKLHCCPQDMKCDVSTSSCHRGLNNITWSANIPALKMH